MDLNRLLHHHQRALIDRESSPSFEARRWAGLSAAYYAAQISGLRSALGREDPFTCQDLWTGAAGGMVACG